MVLFSLLMAILVERLKLLPISWQFEQVLQVYQAVFFGDKTSLSSYRVVVALLLPAAVVYTLSYLVAGMFFGGLSLALWVLVAVVCFSHQKQRDIFKQYMLAAHRSDVQACYHFAAELDCAECLDAVNAEDLGVRVGQSVAWLNYRYYGAVALWLIVFGPVGAVLYCTGRFYADESKRKALNLPNIDKVMNLLDWLPCRLFALFYAFSGQFNEGLQSWRRYSLTLKMDARTIVIKAASAAQPLPESGDAPICVRATLAMLALSKRNFIFILVNVSLLTIFGFLR